MTPEQRALELIDLVYRTVEDPTLWQEVAEGFSDHFGGAAVALTIQSPGMGSRAYRVGLRDDLQKLHRRSGPGGPWLAEIAQDLGERFVRLGDYYPAETLELNDYDLEFLEPQGLAREHPLLHVTAPETAVLSSGIVVHRRSEGPRIDDESIAAADRVVPHLRRAIDLHSRLEGSEHTQVALNEVMDRIPTGVVILDARRQLVLQNRMAARIASGDDGFAFDAQGPRAGDIETTKKLRQLIDSATHPPPGRELAGGGFMALPRPSGLHPYPVLITPVLGHAQDRTVEDAAAVMFVSDPEFRDLSIVNVLSSVYGLTRAEAELAELLARGLSLEDAAAARSVTVNTARSQLKQVFAKTDTNRQGQLLQLVLSGVAMIHPDAPPESEDEHG